MSEREIISILTSYENIFGINDLTSMFIRSLSWGLVKLLALISNGLENIIDNIYTLNGFFASSTIVTLFNKLSPIIWVLLAISIGLIGFKIMYDRDFKKDRLIQNILIAILTIVMLPTLMVKLSDATKYGVEALDEVGGSKVNYSANKIIKDNLYDLYYLDSFNFTNKNAKNNINEKYISLIYINETIDKSKTENKDLFSNTLNTTLDGKLTLRKLDDVLFGLMKEEYYRFSIDYLPVIVTLICTIVALLSTSFKTSRIIYELAFVGIFARLLAFSDIGNGQKIKEVVKHIINTFIVLFFIALLLKIYLLFSTWLNDNTSLDMVTKMVMLIGASMGVVDGPNIVERILGIDSGIKSGWSVVMGGVATSKAIVSTVTTLGSIAKKVGSTLNNASSMFGINNTKNNSNSSSSLEQDMNSKSNNDNTSNMNNNNENSNLHSQMKNSDIANEKLSRKDASNDSFVSQNNKSDSNINESKSNSSNSDNQSKIDDNNSSTINSNDDNNISTIGNMEMNEEDTLLSNSSVNSDSDISSDLDSNTNIKDNHNDLSDLNQNNFDDLNSSSNSIADMNNSEILSSKSDSNIDIKGKSSDLNDLNSNKVLDNKDNPVDINSINNKLNKANIVGNRNYDILSPGIFALESQKNNINNSNKNNIKPSNNVTNTNIDNIRSKPSISSSVNSDGNVGNRIKKNSINPLNKDKRN